MYLQQNVQNEHLLQVQGITWPVRYLYHKASNSIPGMRYQKNTKKDLC